MVTPVFTPREIGVIAGQYGGPAAIALKKRERKVVSVRNIWRIDDEWWREEISRLYFELELDNALVITVFHDLIAGTWYQQKY